MNRRWFFLISYAVFLTACSPSVPDAQLKLGNQVPDLLLTDIHTEQKRPLSDFLGRLLVLNIWAPWCAPCIDEMPSLDYLERKLDPDKFAVIGLTADERFLAQEFLQRNGIGFANYFDLDRSQVEGALGVLGFPETLIISQKGILLERIRGWRDWKDASVIENLLRYSTND